MKKKETKEEKYIPLVPEKEKIKEASYRHSSSKLYVSFRTRLLLTLVIFLVVLLSSLFLIINAFNIKKLNEIKINEKSTLDYKVYLNENDIYDNDYLDKDMSYITELIKTIEVYLKHEFKITKKSSFNFNYQILGDLIVEDKSSPEKVYYKKTYILSDNINESIENETAYEINKTISVDYWYYNGLANKFKKDYGVNTTSYLKIYLDVKEETSEDNYYEFKTSSEPSIRIPLSENSIEINATNTSVDKKVADKPEITLRSTPLLLLGIVLLFAAIIILAQIIVNINLLKTKKSKYDKKLEKILNEYDRIIVNTTTPPRKEANIIQVTTFKELLDAYENIKEPIKYYVINEHNKCEFYINHNDEVYIYTLKAVDLEQENK